MQIPEFLKSGDTVSIIGLASKVKQADIITAINILENWGLKIKTGQHLFKDHFRFSGTDTEKLHDFQLALDDPSVKTIFAARGGYGSAKIIDQINWQEFVKHPKWIVGFSDITSVLQHLQHLEIAGIHGLMPVQFKKHEYFNSLENLKKVLFGEKILLKAPSGPYNKTGTSKGILTGGNLSILCSIIGTSSDFNYDNKILFIEDINEEMYRIDRLLNQLKRSGKLSNINGLVVGHFTKIIDDPKDPFGLSLEELILQHMADLNIPIAFNMPIGHVPDNDPVILGMKYQLSISETGSTLSY